MNKLFLLFISLIPSISYTQVKPINSDSITLTKNLWYCAFGRQALLSVNYERDFKISNPLFLSGHFGLGGIPGSHDTIYEGYPGHYTIFTGIALLVGIRPVYLEIGIDPQVYFVEGTSFCNLDGNFGVRFQKFAKSSIFLQISFNPILYTSHTNDFAIPFGFALGTCF